MSGWVIVRHVVALAGRVIDHQTGRPIHSAKVRITAAPQVFTNWIESLAKLYGVRWAGMEERPDQTRTAPDGHFHFMDLPDGNYTLTTTLPEAGTRFGTASATTTVTRDSAGHIILAATEIRLPPTTVSGLITGQNNSPVIMAKVLVRGSGEQVFSDTAGYYLLTGLEAGERTVEVTARGFQAASRLAVLDQAGAVVILNVALAPVTP